jgi:hypothetical protein
VDNIWEPISRCGKSERDEATQMEEERGERFEAPDANSYWPRMANRMENLIQWNKTAPACFYIFILEKDHQSVHFLALKRDR